MEYIASDSDDTPNPPEPTFVVANDGTMAELASPQNRLDLELVERICKVRIVARSCNTGLDLHAVENYWKTMCKHP